MPFKIVCPAGHKLVMAGSAAERPRVCPRCGIALAPDSLEAEHTTPIASISTVNGQSATASPGRSDDKEPPATCYDSLAPRPLAPPPLAPPPQAPEPRKLPVIRVQPNVQRKPRFSAGAGAFASILLVAALASAAPAFVELAASYRGDGLGPSTGPARWALALAWLALLQAAYAAYGWLWSDRASWRIVTLALVVQAGVYAAVLAIVLLASPQGAILGEAGLQLAGALDGGKAALACLSLVCLCATLALFSARQCLEARTRLQAPGWPAGN